MSGIYKSLFEVKLMHEYYLTKKDGSSVFEKNTQQERLDYLLTEFADDLDPINDDIQFEFPPSLQYENLGLKLVPTYSGFRVVARVNVRKLADQSLVYEPAVPFPDNFNLFILLSRKGNTIDAYTNSRSFPPHPGVYYFSNDDLPGTRTFPFLTNAIPAFDPAVQYEQGELSVAGAVIQQFYPDGAAGKWNNVTGTGFINEGDRILLPVRFIYSISDTAGLNQAQFKLKDKDGNELASLTIDNNATDPGKFMLDFSGKAVQMLPGTPFLPADSVHTLEVSGDNGYAGEHQVLFSNELLKSNPWGVINIRPGSITAGFSLFANDGFLVTRKDPLGVLTPAPVFEIPVKSKFVFWRFINNKGKELDLIPAFANYLSKENKMLISKLPRALTRDYFLIHEDGGAGTTYVPNPVSFNLQLDTGSRQCFDIIVPRSDKFPIVI